MKKTFKIEDLDCANCAAKFENAVKEIDGVNAVTVSFMAQKMIVDIEDDKYDEVIKGIKKAAKKTVPDCEVVL